MSKESYERCSPEYIRKLTMNFEAINCRLSTWQTHTNNLKPSKTRKLTPFHFHVVEAYLNSSPSLSSLSFTRIHRVIPTNLEPSFDDFFSFFLFFFVFLHSSLPHHRSHDVNHERSAVACVRKHATRQKKRRIKVVSHDFLIYSFISFRHTEKKNNKHKTKRKSKI